MRYTEKPRIKGNRGNLSLTNPVPVRWTVARSRLDGNDTIIYSNPSISARIEPISNVYTNNKNPNTPKGVLGFLMPMDRDLNELNTKVRWSADESINEKQLDAL